MTHSHPGPDPLSAPNAPRRSTTAWSADQVTNIPRRPVMPGEVRESGWQEVASLDAVARLGGADPVTEDTAPTVFPGSYSFDHLEPVDSTTDATAIPDDDMQDRLREQLRSMSESAIITLDDEEDSEEAVPPASSAPLIESISRPPRSSRPDHAVPTGVRPPPRSLRHTPDFRSMARRADPAVVEEPDNSPIVWVVVGALSASALVTGIVWAFGII